MHALSPERWQTLGPLLDQALDLADSDRESWMAALRERTPADAAAVELLLSGGTPTLMATGHLVEPLAFALHASHAGTQLGAWTLDRPLGTGGMGAVWLATRNDGRFSGHAAVKLLHPSLGEGDGAIRFRREGEVLARLTHPGIARLFDAGVTSHDQPYLVVPSSP